MKIYQLRIDMDNYNYFDGDVDEDLFDGTPLYKKWNPMKVTDGDNTLENGDFRNYIATVFSCNLKTKKILENYLTNQVEFLKLDYHEDFWVMNVLNIVDAIDYQKAKPVKTQFGTLTHFDEYAFKKEMVKDQIIFKIPEFKVVRLFVTEKFKKIIEEHNITGPYFIEVWDSEKE